MLLRRDHSEGPHALGTWDIQKTSGMLWNAYRIGQLGPDWEDGPLPYLLDDLEPIRLLGLTEP